jgi:hypothetical protein
VGIKQDVERRTQVANSNRFQKLRRKIFKLGTDLKDIVEKMN